MWLPKQSNYIIHTVQHIEQIELKKYRADKLTVEVIVQYFCLYTKKTL